MRRNARRNADRSHHPGGPQARQKSVPQGCAASSRMELFKGVWGRCHQQAEMAVPPGRDGHFSHDGTIMPCLPCFVSPILLVRRCAVKLIEPPAICCPHQLYCKVKGVFPAVFQPLIPLFGSLSLVGPGGAVAAGERAFSSEIPPQCYG